MTKLVEPLECGIHIALDADRYHADKSLGSTDIRALRRGVRFLGPDTAATILGSAMHKEVLEGRQAFAGRYMRRPNDPEGATAPEKGAVTKKANATAAAAGMTSLHGDEFDLVTSTGDIIRAHPDLMSAMTGGLREVSIVWDKVLDEHGQVVTVKARIDMLKVRGVGDLKSIANEKRGRLSTVCKSAIKRYRYDIQAAHYLDGRAQVAQFVKAGKIFWHGISSEADRTRDQLYLKDVAACTEYGFQFVFVQKAAPATAWSCTLSPKGERVTYDLDGAPEKYESVANPILEVARLHIDEALAKFTGDTRARFYDPAGWSETEPVAELDISEIPGGEYGWAD